MKNISLTSQSLGQSDVSGIIHSMPSSIDVYFNSLQPLESMPLTCMRGLHARIRAWLIDGGLPDVAESNQRQIYVLEPLRAVLGNTYLARIKFLGTGPQSKHYLQILKRQLLQDHNQELTFAQRRFQLHELGFETHCSYQDLYQSPHLRQFSSQKKPAFQLQFLSPTALSAGKTQGSHFRREIADYVLPDPRRVFESLLFKWNHAAADEMGFSFSSHVLTFVDKHLQITASQLNSQSVILGKTREGKLIQHFAFQGQLNFQVWKYPQRGEVISPAHLKMLQAVLTLARFAEYAGVGEHCTMGLGHVKLHLCQNNTLQR